MPNIIRFIVVSLIIILTGCRQETEINENIEESGFRNVAISKAFSGEINNFLEYTGKIELENVLNISPSFSARIEKIYVQEGDQVKKGKILVQLDSTQLEQTKLQLNNAEKNLHRMEKLLEQDAVEKKTYDEIKLFYEKTLSAYEYLRKNTFIKTPITGIVTSISKKENENFDAMMQPYLIRIVNDDLIKAKINVSDRDIPKIMKNQKAMISITNYEKVFLGKVSFCSPEADLLSGTFLVEIIIENTDKILRHNQFAKVKIVIESNKNAIIIPQEAIVDENTIFVEKNKIAEKRKVITGIENEKQIEIKKGVEAGENVIITGNVGLTNGEKVKINQTN